MFQLNSYKPKVQINWLIKNPKTTLPPFVALLAVLVLYPLCLKANLWSLGFAVAFLVLAIFFLPKKHYKTPLKFTMRI
ncbi:MAG: hypothetical protein IKU89_01880, partial [Oscillospiraceae bacterium]|nr:hypothetical protein [Oscillospiraceae bacterium]